MLARESLNLSKEKKNMFEISFWSEPGLIADTISAVGTTPLKFREHSSWILRWRWQQIRKARYLPYYARVPHTTTIINN